MIFQKLQGQNYQFDCHPVSCNLKSLSSRQWKGNPLPVSITCAGRGVSLETPAQELPKDAVLCWADGAAC